MKKPPFRSDGPRPPRSGGGGSTYNRDRAPPRGPRSDGGGYAPRAPRSDAGSAYVDRPPRAVGPDGFSARPPRDGGGYKPRREGDGAGERSFRPRSDGDAPRPYRPREGGPAGDRPFRPREGGPGGDRPFRPREGGPGGDRPFRPREGGPGGDRPFRPREGGPSGDRPFRPREGGPGGDRPFRPREGGPGGDRPFRPREGGPGGDRPFRPRDGGPGGDRSFRPRAPRDDSGGAGDDRGGYKPHRSYGQERTTLHARPRRDDLTPRTSARDRDRAPFGERQFEPPYRAPLAMPAAVDPGADEQAGNESPDLAEQRRSELRIHGVHAVLALFRDRPEAIRKLWFSASHRDRLADLITWCAREQIGYNEADDAELARVSGSAHHEGVCVAALKAEAVALDTLLATLAAAPGPQCVLLLDQIGNPHNLGAILRSAAHFGVAAVLLAPDSGTSLSGASYRVAEGGAEAQPLAMLASIDQLKPLWSAGYALVATVVEGGASMLDIDQMPERLILALGAEGAGLGDHLRELADKLLSIPGTGAVESLNVAAATAVALATWRIGHPG